MGASYNQTLFILVGFTISPEMEICVFVVLLVIYALSVFGNLAIIAVIWLEKGLHTPMYIFLCCLAAADIGFISCTVPKLLDILATGHGDIHHTACIMQLYFYMSFGSTEFFLLATMSVDRYVAVAHPLRYNSIFTSEICLWVVPMSWAVGFSAFIYPIILVSNLSFCGPFKINHFFCDCSALVKISCSDPRFFYNVFTTIATAIVLVSIFISFVSYFYIINVIINITSTSGKRKALSTCTSHFTSVSLAYGTVIFLYVRPSESVSPDLNKLVNILNSILVPLSNPFIYSLRNKKLLHAIWRTLRL